MLFITIFITARDENQRVQPARLEEPSRVYLPSYPMNQQPRPFKPAIEDSGNALNPSDSPQTPSPGGDTNNGIDPKMDPLAQGGGNGAGSSAPSPNPSGSQPPKTDREPLEPDQGAGYPSGSPQNPDEPASGSGGKGPGQGGTPEFSADADNNRGGSVPGPEAGVDNSLGGTTPTGNGTGSTADDDLSHSPHIHELVVQCAKDQMTINIEFNKPFDGVIYSKVRIYQFFWTIQNL